MCSASRVWFTVYGQREARTCKSISPTSASAICLLTTVSHGRKKKTSQCFTERNRTEALSMTLTKDAMANTISRQLTNAITVRHRCDFA